MQLHDFKYHPNPLETGSVEEADSRCTYCGTVTGYIYIGPVFAEDKLDDCICPRDIATLLLGTSRHQGDLV